VYLAVRRGEEIRREHLMGEFWPDADPTSARNNLKTALSAIRRAFKDSGFDPDAIVNAGRDSVRWIAKTSIDSREFERCSVEIPAERSRAIDLYGGEFLPGDYNVWAAETRDRLGARFEDILRAELAQRASPEIAERLLTLDPFSDSAYLALMDDAVRRGNRREAQLLYRRYSAALAEIGDEPSAELAVHAGIRTNGEADRELGFLGRTGELAEIREWLDDTRGPATLIVSGIAGIGKSALIARARELFGDAWDRARTVVCARPESLPSVREAHPEAREIVLGPLSRGDITVALARRYSHGEVPRIVETLWSRCEGHPLLVQAAIRQLDSARFPREVERRFEQQLEAAGEDALPVAQLLALEPQLGIDDLVALLDWSHERVVDARDRLSNFGIIVDERVTRFSFSIFATVSLRALPPGRRHATIERIAERLKLHEHPGAKLRLAQHSLVLRRTNAAASAYLEAGRDFMAFGAWSNALDALNAGIALLEQLATSATATSLLRELYLSRGRALYETGSFPSALHSLDSAMDLSVRGTDSAVRADALVTIGHALSRVNHANAAWSAAQQAAEEARQAPDLRSELEAYALMARLLFIATKYDEAIDCAKAAYEHAVEAREWTAAATLAQRAADAARRQLNFSECFTWVQRQLDAAVLAGPVIEAQAHYALGSVAYAVNDLERALEQAHQGLGLIAGVRRRQSFSTMPLGQLEWNCHQALAHTYVAAGALENALVECEWLMRSPWVFNTTACAAMTFATVVDARLASGTPGDIAASTAFAKRIPELPPSDPAAFLDALTRARIMARTGDAQAASMLRHALELIDRAAALVPDQIYISYNRLADAAYGIDDSLSARAAQAASFHHERVVSAAGEMWRGGLV
jgi:tetratricopeptide (TPR) repeat protein